jgi:hypothetical protein
MSSRICGQTCSRVGTRWRFPIEASFSLRHTPRRRQNRFCCSEQFGSRCSTWGWASRVRHLTAHEKLRLWNRRTVCGPVVAAGCTRTPCWRVLDIDPSTGLRLELTDALLDQGRSAGAVPVAPIVLGAAAGRPITLLPASCCSSPCATSTSRAAIGGSSNTRTWSTAASPGPPAPTGESLGPQTTPCAQTVTPDPRLLFRFSAPTVNAHRIHYDQDYAGTYRRFSWPGRSRAAAGDLHGRADTSMRANSRPPVLLSAAAPRLRRPTSTRPGCTLGPRGRR